MTATQQALDIGDVVAVNFNGAQYTLCSEAGIIKLPYATGDTWGFEDLKTKTVHYVSEGCTITLLRKAKP